MTDDDALKIELVRLRKGRALKEPQLLDRLGQQLHAIVTKTADRDSKALSHGQARLALADSLQRAANALPVDLREAAEAMFALGDTASMAASSLGARQADLACRWQRDLRTVRRRCDDALALLVEHLAPGGRPEDTADGATRKEVERRENHFVGGTWFTESLEVLLRLDVDFPRAVERRTVVALVDGLEQVTASTSLKIEDPEGSPSIGSEIDFGGLLIGAERFNGGVTIAHVALPRPLRAGQRHTYGRTLFLSADHSLRPQYFVAPQVRFDRFDLKVRFRRSHLPDYVWLHAGVPYPVADSRARGADLIEVDGVGEVQRTFTDLNVGSCYGAGWEFSGK